MDSPIDFITNFSPSDLAYKFIFNRESKNITVEEINANVIYQGHLVQNLYNSFSLSQKQLFKSKIKLLGSVNDLHLNFIITVEDDSYLHYLYSNDINKFTYHRYYVEKLKELLIHLITEVPDIIVEDETLESLKERVLKITNKSFPRLPMKFVFEELKVLVKNLPKENESYLTYENFETFIKLGFGREDLPKIKANIPNGHIGKFLRIFHKFYSNAVRDYSEISKLEPFHSLVERSFSNFTRAQIVHNLQSRY
jgi:hypothetical protein